MEKTRLLLKGGQSTRIKTRPPAFPAFLSTKETRSRVNSTKIPEKSLRISPRKGEEFDGCWQRKRSLGSSYRLLVIQTYEDEKSWKEEIREGGNLSRWILPLLLLFLLFLLRDGSFTRRCRGIIVDTCRIECVTINWICLCVYMCIRHWWKLERYKSIIFILFDHILSIHFVLFNNIFMRICNWDALENRRVCRILRKILFFKGMIFYFIK